MDEQINIAVLGGGSFGTAIANMVAGNGQRVTLWMRDANNARRCQETRENPHYLPGHRLADGLHITADLAAAVAGADVVFFAIPSESLRSVAEATAPLLAPGVIAVSTAKGMEARGFRLMSEVLGEVLNQPRVGVVSGPNLAPEVARGEITATVVASTDPAVCKAVQRILRTAYFRVYANTDVRGVELAGALKNIYAIEAGMATAMGVGQNTMSVLITRSLAEMTRFAAQLGANPMTFLGLSGVGDLFVTCTSPLSRNFRVGKALGRGLSLQQAIAEVGQVAEGVNTTRIVCEKAAELGIYMPLATALYDVMFKGAAIPGVLRKMMLAEQTDDVEFLNLSPAGD
jgi:glycerol-3-phosphate dehydrogenase (NAD(P)+)